MFPITNNLLLFDVHTSKIRKMSVHIIRLIFFHSVWTRIYHSSILLSLDFVTACEKEIMFQLSSSSLCSWIYLPVFSSILVHFRSIGLKESWHIYDMIQFDEMCIASTRIALTWSLFFHRLQDRKEILLLQKLMTSLTRIDMQHWCNIIKIPSRSWWKSIASYMLK